MQDRLKKVQTDDQEKAQESIVKLGANSGYDFNKEDLQQVTQELVASLSQNGELDESELEAVSGGSVLLAIGITAFGVATIRAATAVIVGTTGAAYSKKKLLKMKNRI